MIKKNRNSGYFLPFVLVFGAIAIAAVAGLVSFANTNLLSGRRAITREQAFQIAEAGIDYYRWHLAHNGSDYSDGGGPFPHVHNFYDKSGILIGTFSLTITPPPAGSTLVAIKSQGVASTDTSVKRTIVSKLAIPSFANYAVVADAGMRFGVGTDVVGPIHVNGGVRFDGVAHNIVTSSLGSYNDPDHSDSSSEFGVHTHVNTPPATGVNDSFRPLEAPPSPVPTRLDVFMAGRSFPVSTVSFGNIAADISNLKSLAQSGGRYFADSGGGNDGYKVVFKTNDTYDVYRVTSIQSLPGSCSNQSGTGSWSVGNSTLLGNYTNPANGVIFFEDDVWVEGQINSARITLAAGTPTSSGGKSITINNNLLYTNYDGQDSLALIAEGDVNVGLFSMDTLRIDAALMAENGRVGRHHYTGSCNSYTNRSDLTLFGMIGSSLRYGFAYVDGTGYETRNLIYDASMLYAPPPSFPLTTDKYQIVSWQETANN
ncbi:hypothetical protein KW796_02990 [Candidatus Parcubacteria bacterium]|nr:hypothetical protein [Candidatus Parcubacteria bacterium]